MRELQGYVAHGNQGGDHVNRDTIIRILTDLDAEIGRATQANDEAYVRLTVRAHEAVSQLRVDGVDLERLERFNDTTGALTWNYRSAAEHPDRCTCQGTETTPHKHYDHAPYNCARCLECKSYTPAVAGKESAAASAAATPVEFGPDVWVTFNRTISSKGPVAIWASTIKVAAYEVAHQEKRPNDAVVRYVDALKFVASKARVEILERMLVSMTDDCVAVGSSCSRAASDRDEARRCLAAVEKERDAASAKVKELEAKMAQEIAGWRAASATTANHRDHLQQEVTSLARILGRKEGQSWRDALAEMVKGHYDLDRLSDSDVIYSLKNQLDETTTQRDAALRVVAAAKAATKLCSCGGTGMRPVHCSKCDDSGEDHDDCPDDEPCDRQPCIDLRAALAVLQVGT